MGCDDKTMVDDVVYMSPIRTGSVGVYWTQIILLLGTFGSVMLQ